LLLLPNPDRRPIRAAAIPGTPISRLTL